MNASFRLPTAGAALVAATLFAVSQLAAPLASADTAQPAGEPAYLKDLEPRQRPMVFKPPPASGAGLSVMAAVDRPDGRYRDGDSLALNVSVTEDAYVWVFDTGTSGKVHQIFPNRYETDNFVRAGKQVVIPRDGADYQFLVSHPRGTELLTVIASKDSTPLVLDLIDKEIKAGPFLALRGDAVSVAKDLSVSLKNHTSWVSHHEVIRIE